MKRVVLVLSILFCFHTTVASEAGDEGVLDMRGEAIEEPDAKARFLTFLQAHGQFQMHANLKDPDGYKKTKQYKILLQREEVESPTFSEKLGQPDAWLIIHQFRGSIAKRHKSLFKTDFKLVLTQHVENASRKRLSIVLPESTGFRHMFSRKNGKPKCIDLFVDDAATDTDDSSSAEEAKVVPVDEDSFRGPIAILNEYKEAHCVFNPENPDEFQVERHEDRMYEFSGSSDLVLTSTSDVLKMVGNPEKGSCVSRGNSLYLCQSPDDDEVWGTTVADTSMFNEKILELTVQSIDEKY